MKIFRFQGKTVPPTNINARTRFNNQRRRSEYRHRVLRYEEWAEEALYENYPEWVKELTKYPNRPLYLGIYLIRRECRNFDLVEVWKTILHTLQQYGYFPDDDISQVVPVHLGIHTDRKDSNCGFLMVILRDDYKEEMGNILGLDGNFEAKKRAKKEYRDKQKNKKK